ncbi:nucleotidyltransferase family protein, partial [Planktotalea sp.]|uniref:nucleotidyltransferase family protein n=1 Tax=Planktotalea sp. TaxID=2029877 RepID=UPI003296EC73
APKRALAMHKTGALILAAGLSQRMGERNKLLLPIDGVPMVRRVVQQYRAAIEGPITVVTGHEAEAVQAVLSDLDVRCVVNPEYAKGQQTSVAFGLAQCPEVEALLIGLGDQPLLRASDIVALLDVHARLAPMQVSIPALDDIRGNPIVVPHQLRAQLTRDPERPGCMRFTRDNPDMVHRHPLTAKGFYTDVDTPDSYAALCLEWEHPS